MTAGPWHLDTDLLDRYAAFTLGPSGRASVESHLQACSTCRAAVAESEAAAGLDHRLDHVWAATLDRIDVPRRSWLHRLAAAVGVPDHLARLLGITAAFRAAWVASVALVMAAAVAIERGGLGPVPFLLLSPLVPVVGVAAAYGGGTRDRSCRPFEVATPFGELRLVLLRSTAVTVASIALLAAVSLLLPGVGLESVAWLLPALALTAATLALTTRVPPERAAWVVGVGWLATLQIGGTLAPRAQRPTATDLGALGLPLQLVALIVLVVSTTAFVARRHQIDLPTR